MGMTKKTTEQVLSMATTKLAGDITTLSAQRDSAISIFRETAHNLETINTGLRASMANLDTLAAFIQEQRGNAEKMVSDNEKVKAKIFDIIGE